MIRDEFKDMFEMFGDQMATDADLLDFSNEYIQNGNIPPLFRYSSADYYNIRGLETQSLFLSPIGSMNDIFEGISCKINDEVIDRIDDLGDIAFIKSFSEEKGNLLMWAHYAGNYTGMCVEYDFNKLRDEILCHLFPVFYSKTRYTYLPLEQAVLEHKDLKRMNEDDCYPNDCEYVKDIMSLFLSKSTAWSYEREWRIVATYPQINNRSEDMGDSNVQLYAIDSQVLPVENCIKAVYLGTRMKKNIQDHITEICANKLGGIPVYTSRLSKNKYELEFDSVL